MRCVAGYLAGCLARSSATRRTTRRPAQCGVADDCRRGDRFHQDQAEARNREAIAAQLGQQVPPGVVTVPEVINMVQARVNDDLIINHIHAHGMVAPPTSTDLIVLQAELGESAGGASDADLHCATAAPGRDRRGSGAACRSSSAAIGAPITTAIIIGRKHNLPTALC